jgi:hypothetical protein
MTAIDRPIEEPERPRLLPDEPLPPYSYVTGKFPHPIRDPNGHSFGLIPAACAAPEPSHWRECRPYLYGLDLFNHGYYWEAHETWEQIWHAAGRRGPMADFFKGLIKLAAAGVKVREGRASGVRSHARRAAELFRGVAESLESNARRYFGLSFDELIGWADAVAGKSPQATSAEKPVEIVFGFVLKPE